VIRVLCSYFIQPLHGRNLLRMYSWQLIRFQSVGIIAEAAWCDFSERIIFSGCEQSQQLLLQDLVIDHCVATSNNNKLVLLHSKTNRKDHSFAVN
jgi:hypothetical protein